MLSKVLTPELTEAAKSHAKEFLEGLKTIIGIDDDAVARDIYSKSINSDSVASLLPHLGWDETSNLFILDEGDHQEDKQKKGKQYLGFCIEVIPQTGATNEMEDILEAMINLSPKGTTVSVHNYGSPNIMETLREMANRRFQDEDLGIRKENWEKRNSNIYQKMVRKRINYYLHGTFKPLFNDHQAILIRNFRSVISVVIPLNPKKDEDVQKAINIREQFISTLNSAKLPAWRWKPEDLINFVSDFFDHTRMSHVPSRREKEYDKFQKLRSQVTDRSVETIVKSDKLEFINTMSELDTVAVNYSVTQYPKYGHLAAMSFAIGDFFQNELSYPCPFMVTTTAFVPDHDEVQQKTAIKNASAQRKLEGYMAKIDPLLKDEAMEWKEALKVTDDGGTLIEMMTTITAIAPKEQESKVRSDIVNLWRSKGFKLASDKYQQLVTFLAGLPLVITPSFSSDLKKMQRYHTKYSRNFISFLPLMGEWKGTNNPVMTFIGRRGQITPIDLFDNIQGNYNFSVVGASGSGKSFFVQEMLMSYRANNARVWVIDVGRSYLNLCDLLDGEFLEFSKESNININPFTALADVSNTDAKDKEDVLTMLQSVVMTMMSPEVELSSWHKAKISEGIIKVFEHVGRKMTITDLAEYFKNGGSVDKDEIPKNERDQRIVDMGDMLFDWTKYGSMGHYFDGEANLSFTNPFTVLELEELKGKKALQAVVLMIMMFHITQSLYLNRDGSKAIIFLDEAWEVLSGRNQATADFIEAGYRRARKYGGSFGTATQGYRDYFKSPAAEAALQNSDWNFTLRQKPESIEALEEFGLLDVKNNAFRKRSLLSLNMIAGKYSEIFISSPMGSGVVRLMTDPYSSFLYSSKTEHFSRIASYKKQGYSITEAVEKTMKDFNISEPEPYVAV